MTLVMLAIERLILRVGFPEDVARGRVVDNGGFGADVGDEGAGIIRA